MVGVQSIASLSGRVGGTEGEEGESDGRPNIGFEGVIIGFEEREREARRSGSCEGRVRGVECRDVVGGGVGARR